MCPKNLKSRQHTKISTSIIPTTITKITTIAILARSCTNLTRFPRRGKMIV